MTSETRTFPFEGGGLPPESFLPRPDLAQQIGANKWQAQSGVNWERWNTPRQKKNGCLPTWARRLLGVK